MLSSHIYDFITVTFGQYKFTLTKEFPYVCAFILRIIFCVLTYRWDFREDAFCKQ